VYIDSKKEDRLHTVDGKGMSLNKIDCKWDGYRFVFTQFKNRLNFIILKMGTEQKLDTALILIYIVPEQTPFCAGIQQSDTKKSRFNFIGTGRVQIPLH
jgi:hypothetical protein